jgi:GNAT superfamily N-acetyltransferase
MARADQNSALLPLLPMPEMATPSPVSASLTWMRSSNRPLLGDRGKMQKPSALQIRNMTRDDVDLALAWAAREGWNPGIADAECFYAVDPAGFLLGCLDGEPICCISVVAYGLTFGFVGFYIVKPELRGRGYGHHLWQIGMARLKSRIVGLDGVIAQQENYKRSGFVFAHRNIRYGGVLHCEHASDRRVTFIGAESEKDVLAYDRIFFPAPRDNFLQCWLRPEQRKAMALVEKGQVRGYGVVRACRNGYKVGPLFADDEQGADILLRALAASANGQPVFLDCPEPNRSATDLATRYGLSPVFETARMYRGGTPDVPLRRIYGITTLELG